MSLGARLKADALLTAVTVVWGSTFVMVSDALQDSDVFTFLALRFGLGAIVLTPIAGRLRVFESTHLRRGVLLGTLLFAGFATQTAGLLYTTPSRSAFITGLYVAAVPCVAYVLFRRIPGRWTGVGIACAIAGMYLLTRGRSEEAARAAFLGDGLTLLCAVFYAVHIALTEPFSRGTDPRALVAVQLWVVSLLSLACLPFVDAHLVFSARYVWALVVCGVFASAVALAVQTWAQQRTTAVRAGLIMSMEPVYTVVFSVGLGRERLGQAELMGGGLMLLGVIVSETGGLLWAR